MSSLVPLRKVFKFLMYRSSDLFQIDLSVIFLISQMAQILKHFKVGLFVASTYIPVAAVRNDHKPDS